MSLETFFEEECNRVAAMPRGPSRTNVCSYCKSVHYQERCPNCGAPNRQDTATIRSISRFGYQRINNDIITTP